MASRIPTRIGDHWVEIGLGLAAGALIVAGLTPSSADAGIFGKKTPPVDFSAAHAPAVVAAPAPANGSIFQVSDGYAPLYEGWRARRVGDPLTIVLVERTAASKSSGTKLNSDGSIAITPPVSGPLSFLKSGALSGGTTRGFTGEGAADQSNSLSGEITVTVAASYPNGTMLVQGQKRVTLNRGDEFVQIKGLVRTADIDANNRILSTRVADAQIAYTGKGDVARAGRQGWLGRFFSVVSPF